MPPCAARGPSRKNGPEYSRGQPWKKRQESESRNRRSVRCFAIIPLDFSFLGSRFRGVQAPEFRQFLIGLAGLSRRAVKKAQPVVVFGLCRVDSDGAAIIINGRCTLAPVLL